MDFKGSSSHAAEHKHGVQPRPQPANPQTLEQRVSAIEQFIEQESGHSVAEHLALAAAKREQARRVAEAEQLQAGNEATQGEATT